jgi:magnesium-transporting ATPase (P-type)
MAKDFIELVTFIFANPLKEGLGFVFLGLALFIIYKMQPFKIYEHFSLKNEKEHLLAKELLELKHLSNESQLFLTEQLERLAFKRYCGIAADSKMRTALIAFHKKNQKEIRWIEIKAAYFNMRFKGESLATTMNIFDHIAGYFIILFSFIIASFAIFILMYSIYVSRSVPSIQFFALLMIGMLLFISSMFIYKSNASYFSLKK